MVPLEELEFAQKFPFSATGKRIVKELDVPLNGSSEQVKQGTAARLRAAFAREFYFQRGLKGHREMLEADVLSFALAKVYISVTNNSKLFASFAKSNSDTAFKLLEEEKGEALKIRLAQEFGVDFKLPEERVYAVKVQDFLSSMTSSDALKLVNQSVENGRVLLNEERFSRFLAGMVFSEIIASLPLPLEGIPASVRREALILGEEFREKQRAAFKQISGKVRPELFPPCMEKLYADLLQGRNLSHLARFDLTSFLNAVGMPEEQITKSFSNAPNYKEKVTRYQVRKILHGGRMGKGYSAASCAKLRTHALCTARCNVKHPAQYYRNMLGEARKGEKGK